MADGGAVNDTFNPYGWHEVGRDVVVCRHREMEGNTVYTREMVLSKENGLIRDCTYSIRLYEFQSLASLLEQAGFKRVNVHTDFSPHRCKGDYGFMNRRMLATGQKP